MRNSIFIIAILIVFALLGLSVLDSIEPQVTTEIIDNEGLPLLTEGVTMHIVILEDDAPEEVIEDDDRLTVYIYEKSPEAWIEQKNPDHEWVLKHKGIPAKTARYLC